MGLENIDWAKLRYPVTADPNPVATEPLGVCKVVDGHELENMTGRGWELVSAHTEEVPAWEYRGENSYGQPGPPEPRQNRMGEEDADALKDYNQARLRMVTRRRYVVRLHRSKQLEQLQDSKDQQEGALQELQRDKYHHEVTASKAVRDKNDLDEKLEKALASLKREREMMEDESDRMEVMERHLSAARDALGSDRWRQLVLKSDAEADEDEDED